MSEEQRGSIVNKEKVLELAKQAGLEYNFDPMLWLKYEKFAELIVRECIDKAERYGLGCDAVEQLKEHLGVEE